MADGDNGFHALAREEDGKKLCRAGKDGDIDDDALPCIREADVVKYVPKEGGGDEERNEKFKACL